MKRKLQVSNGHYLDTDHLARIVNVIQSDKQRKFTLGELVEETGLPLRQIRNRISIGRAMGLFQERSIKLSALGELVFSHDMFLDSRATLEYLHYMASGNRENLVWFEVFNTILNRYPITDYDGWVTFFQSMLKGQYSDKSLKDHLTKELRFIINAYEEGPFKRLGLVQRDYQDKLYRVRYADFDPIVFAAIIYHYGEKEGEKLFQIEDIFNAPGSPAGVYGLDSAHTRVLVEILHDRGFLRYETTHNLDQIRLSEGGSSLEFLTAYYEEREPVL